ncbi:uncharacterized protein V1510DRAFT_418017 [Dipodascopsis tothii]|uniref:uncharacterized protein n=1 Tax=Dipodascopsis tothii TaxID=44089 RepID=UPI0034CF23F8
MELFAEAKAQGRPLFVCAPMVRYSKLPMRALLHHFNVDVNYTPMMLAREFSRSHHARDADFATNTLDGGVVAQFGASCPEDFVKAVGLIRRYVDGVGLNCGCPIKEQARDGVGAVLMETPEKIAGMVRAAREAFPDLVIEAKIRIYKDSARLVELARLIEAAGASYMIVHGRTRHQRSSEKADLDAIALVKRSVSIPVVANGDCFSLADAYRIAAATGADGVMSARGLLENPALFAGYEYTPWKAVELFWDYARAYGLPFRNTIYMLSQMVGAGAHPGRLLTKLERREMNQQPSFDRLEAWLDERFVLRRRGDPLFATAEYDGYRRPAAPAAAVPESAPAPDA